MIALRCTVTQGVDTVGATVFPRYGTSEGPISPEDQGTYHRIFSVTRR